MRHVYYIHYTVHIMFKLDYPCDEAEKRERSTLRTPGRTGVCGDLASEYPPLNGPSPHNSPAHRGLCPDLLDSAYEKTLDGTTPARWSKPEVRACWYAWSSGWFRGGGGMTWDEPGCLPMWVGIRGSRQVSWSVRRVRLVSAWGKSCGVQGKTNPGGVGSKLLLGQRNSSAPSHQHGSEGWWGGA